MGKDGIRSRCSVQDQLGPVQGKDSMSPIEAQDEAVWTFMCVAIGKCDKMFFGSSSLLPCQFARGSATRVQQHSTNTRPAGAVSEQCQHGTSPSFSSARRVRQPSASAPFLSIRSAEAVSEEIVIVVPTSESVEFGCLFIFT